MSLQIGTRLASYEIIGPLGAGGMGEVYRARDTKLDRDVAIKVLPDLFAADPDRLARFEREAKTLAAVNHPNIAQVHGVIEQPPALVMELVEGEDLAQLLARGPIPLDQALPIARQIAEALEAAHERGIIHRDLKPANVKVRDDGTVKVLDFGLAKAFAGPDAPSGPDVMNSPTLTSPARLRQGFGEAGTQMGMILGTAAYMAPEQAKGKPIDKRADIWAFGVVLFELLTGRRAFDGESITDVLSAVTRDEPRWAELPSSTPASIRRLLQRCLEKDPRRRLRDIGDARLEIADALEKGGTSSEAVDVHGPKRRSRGVLFAAAGLVAAGVLGGWLAASLRRAPATSPSTMSFRQLTELPGPETHPDISPDGRQLIYVSSASGNKEVYLLRVGGDRAINLTAGSQADDDQPAFSPDGESIAFHSSREGGGLFIMGATGESVRRVTAAGYDPAWSPDQRFLAYSTESVDDPYSRSQTAELWTVDVTSGKLTRLLAGDAVQPAWSPGGERIAYWANTTGQRDIWTVAAGGGAPVAVTQDGATDWAPQWSPDGTWLYFSSDRGGSMNLWRVPIDPLTGLTRGDPEAVTRSVRAVGRVRIARDGARLVAMAYERTTELSTYHIGPGDVVRPLATLRPSAHWCNLSPDGSWFACSTVGVQEDIILLRTDGSELRRLTNDMHKDRVPTWSPDGQSLALYSTRSGQWNYWSIRTDGSGLRQLTGLGEDQWVVWSPDGQEMVLCTYQTELWRFPVRQVATRESATRLEPPAAAARFVPLAWSGSGGRIAGVQVDERRRAAAFGVWNMGTGAYRTFDVKPNDRSLIVFRQIGGWFPDSRRFIAGSPEGVVVIDAADGSRRVLLPHETDDWLHLSRDGRTLLVERAVLDSDIWMLEQK
ncbi:MAG: protein kinase [Acidobacteria bacterium]|nr:protein kinase [Acidobacteriota bacterium]